MCLGMLMAWGCAWVLSYLQQSSDFFHFRYSSHQSAVEVSPISASGVECDTADCFLHSHEMMQNVCDPTKHKTPPDVDLLSLRSPAKLASQKRTSLHSDGLLPMKLVRTSSLV